ncbi:MAG: sensor histidine kinase [Dehalococcoidia bacterium]
MNRRNRLLGSMRARLMVSHLGLCIVAIAVLFVTVRLTAPSFFDAHIGPMPFMRGTNGTPMAAEAAELDAALTRSLNEGFLVAAAVALPLGVVASLLIARQVSRPVRSLASASRRIADGDYAQRVAADGPGELAELGASFNTMAAALESVEQRRVALIGDIAHELRTPVTVLRGYVEGLADGVFPASTDTWEKLDAETARLSRLVEELQELSRAEAGQLAVSAELVDPGRGLRNAAERFTPAFEEKGLRLEVVAPDGLPAVLADPERLVQLLSSLIDNALKYTPAPGTVTIAARREDRGVAFSVRDSGTGIPPEHLPHVFERFYRIDRSRSRGTGGSGVGLTIARALATAMGGTLRAESPGVGQGSTFTLVLPTVK